MSLRRWGGWILAETVLALAILSLVVPPLLRSLSEALAHAERLRELQVQPADQTGARRDELATACAELDRMRRAGTDERVIIRELRERYPGLGISSDGTGCRTMED